MKWILPKQILFDIKNDQNFVMHVLKDILKLSSFF